MPLFRRAPIFNELAPYLRLLSAYNADNFHQNQRSIRHSVFYAFLATFIILVVPITVMLGFWNLFEKDADLTKYVVALPLLISIIQMHLTFIAMVMKSRTINETIHQINQIADKRELVFLCLFSMKARNACFCCALWSKRLVFMYFYASFVGLSVFRLCFVLSLVEMGAFSPISAEFLLIFANFRQLLPNFVSFFRCCEFSSHSCQFLITFFQFLPISASFFFNYRNFCQFFANFW